MSGQALGIIGLACGAFAFLGLLPLAIAAAKTAARADRDHEAALARFEAEQAAEQDEADAYCWLVDPVTVAAEDMVKDVEDWLAHGAPR